MGTVRLYHGTTLDAATAIQRDGFESGRHDVVALIASRYSIDVDELRRAVRGSYVTVGHRRDEVSLASHPWIARAYAGRVGGEAAFEVTCAAYRLRNPVASTAEAQMWAADQMSGTPAVVSVDVPFNVIEPELPRPRTSRGEAWTFDTWLSFVDGLGDRVWGRNLRLPGPISNRWVASIEAVERVVREEELARMLPAADRTRVMNSPSRPPSIDPDGRLFGMAAVEKWLRNVGVAQAPRSAR